MDIYARIKEDRHKHRALLAAIANSQGSFDERHAVPDVKQEADDIIDSLEKTDRDVRAERDVGKGNRAGEKQSGGEKAR